MRLFIAIPLPPDLCERASRLLPEPLPALRRVPPQNMHVTLAFLGETPDARLDDVTAAAAEAASPVPAFRLVLDHAGRFPARGRPRVVWLGIGAGAESVARLGEAVAAGLRSRSLRFDDRPLSAHLTLARVRDDARLPEAKTVGAAVDELVVPTLATEVGSIAVFRSVLSPKGPTYTALATLPLGVAARA